MDESYKGTPLYRVYLQGLDLTFRWRRGDDHMDILQGKDMSSHDNENRNVVDRHPVRRDGWQDGAEVYLTVDRWTRANHPDWHRKHGPVRPPKS